MKITNVVIEGINHKDAPDYVDAFIASADIDGKPATDEQLDKLNEDADLVYSLVMLTIY